MSAYAPAWRRSGSSWRPIRGRVASTAAAGAAVTVARVVSGGVVVLRSDVHSSGDPAPFRLLSLRDAQGRVVSRGTPIPEDLTVVTARIRLPATTPSSPPRPRTRHATLTLPCPRGMKLGSLQFPNYELGRRISLAYSKGSIPGWSTSALVNIHYRDLERPFVFTFGVDCRRPDRYGSIGRDNRRLEHALQRGERRLGHICTRSQGVRPHP